VISSRQYVRRVQTGIEERAAAETIRLPEIGGAMAVCRYDGSVIGVSPTGRMLLGRIGVHVETLPAPLPSSLWKVIVERPIGEAVQWRSPRDSQCLLGCTRYPLAEEHWLLVMSEISEKHRVLSQQLHHKRLESLGRLVATTAHDLRSPLASIVFNTDVLVTKFGELSEEAERETLMDIQTAANRLRGTIDCLLDYVRLGPPVSTDICLKEVLHRVGSLLRPLFRGGSHRLVVELDEETDLARGNAFSIEQIFVNLIVNAIEASTSPVTIRVTSQKISGAEMKTDDAPVDRELVRVLVEDDGPGISPEHRLQVFDPFFTTKKSGMGLGLSASREAAREAGGEIELVRWIGGAAFAIYLPAARRRTAELV
jgi:signal transduction histidine kinase